METRLLCSVALVTFLCVVVHCATSTTVLQRLQQHIVSKQTLPIRNTTVSMASLFDIAIDFIPVAIIGLNEETQVFAFSGIIVAAWLDLSSAWNPADFNNTHAVTIESNLLWSPQVSAINSVSRITTTLKEDALIVNNGQITMFYVDAYETSCEIDTGYFPFDEQTCDVLLFPSGRYRFYTPKSDVDTPEYFFRSNEWRLVSVRLQNRSYMQPVFELSFPIQTVVIQFKLKRYSAFYVMSILSPIGILSLMNACVFLLPVESGEKMSFLVSILVSYAMFLNFVYSTMPRSDSLSRLTIYLMLVVSQSCLSIMSTIYLLNMYHASGQPGGGCVAFGMRTSLRSKVKPDNRTVDSFVKDSVSKSKTSIRRIDRFMFLVFSCSALLSLMVFVIY
ncbi:neuronal acetylcholine receptor subunit alpha-2-like [Gigantopelta aegis]|uniref:neuronal acetylcholine receptor subunit alpha-2-like n=1 Tax=Gigantopelta aegis TaxID=1735272 RepID=UPI001B889373|nr:neuronal acetylcholine receptor subunit alpha-2-like [Gigantopelta aegis]